MWCCVCTVACLKVVALFIKRGASLFRHKSESFAILNYCMDNYKDENCYIIEYLKGSSPPEEETNAVQEPMEEEIIKTDRKSVV